MKKRRKKGRYHVGLYISSKAGQTYKHRSGWEFSYMKYLDANDDVVVWSYEPVSIEYVSNIRTAKIRRYIPDFLVTYTDGSRQLVEVKPARRMKNPIVKKKLAAAKLWCDKEGVELCVVTEIELTVLGLLK